MTDLANRESRSVIFVELVTAEENFRSNGLAAHERQSTRKRGSRRRESRGSKEREKRRQREIKGRKEEGASARIIREDEASKRMEENYKARGR